jgi:uncharacterized protein YjbI with pentapeptide repeats
VPLGQDTRGPLIVVLRLEDHDLQRADLDGSHLEGARLFGSDLDKANLNGTCLQDAEADVRTK